MPRQLIYTSAPRGLTPGQSGYCTVARSRDLREALIPRIEKLSYYTPEANYNPIICAHRILDLRGTHFHVLSRIVDAGLDFTRRRSFLAHHLIFDPAEIQTAANPAEIFLNWQGWLNNWDGDPAWLDDNRALPELSPSERAIAKADIWVTGDDPRGFVQALMRLGADWSITFTNYFQPGDHPDDFDIKAAWPNTAGYEEARRLDAAFIRIEDAPRVEKRAPEIISTPQEPKAVSPRAAPEQRHHKRAPLRLWKFGAATALLVAVGMMFFKRPQIPAPAQQLAPVVIKQDPLLAQLQVLFPPRPTWMTTPEAPVAVGPLNELMANLRANEIFTKDLACTIQTNLLKTPIAAILFADPERGVLRLNAPDAGTVEIGAGEELAVKTELDDSFAIEIPGRFRLIVIQEPVDLPLRFLKIGKTVELQPSLAERLQRTKVAKGAQWALMPVVKNKDALGDAAEDFAIVPATILDLAELHSHAEQVLASKEAKLRGFENEQAKLKDEQRKLLTDPQTRENSKKKIRLRALDLAISKARQEIESLRAKADAIPKEANQIDRFALFLCLSNVNTEIFRFSDKP
jgi:hypothetical protein